jgi:PAS domain S-box-containing protein
VTVPGAFRSWLPFRLRRGDPAIEPEQVRLLYRGLRTALAGRLLVGLVFVAALWGAAPTPALLGWSAALVALTACYAAVMVAYGRRRAEDRIGSWSRAHLAGAIASGLLWGLGGWLFLPAASVELQAFVVVLYAGVTAGSLASHTASLGATLGFIYPAAVPVTLRLLVSDSPLLRALSLLVVLFLVLLTVGARRINASILGHLRLRAESDRREAALAESERRYRTLFEFSEDPMWLIVGQRFVMANAAAARCLGYGSPEELVDLHPSELSPERQPDGESSREKADLNIQRALERGYQRFEWQHRRSSGEVFPVEVTLTRIPHRGGQALFCVWRDVTERKRVERALVQAREEALAASRAKSEFLATMSHEIRTPMNSVLGMAELLAEADLNGEEREHAEAIHGSARALLAVIDDILDFSKIEAGRLELREGPFDARRCLGDVRRVFEVPARRKGLRIVLECEGVPAMPMVGDEGRLRQVLVNLVGNAVKFTHEGEVRVRAQVAPAGPPDRGWLHVEISDTGIGMDEATLRRIFEPFLQGDGSTTRRFGGTGLGLSITRRLIEAMGGGIGVESVPGKGSVFGFEIPLALASDGFTEGRPSSGAPVAEAEGTEPLVNGAGGVPLVLVAEDVPTNQRVAEVMLRRLGVRCEIVEDGESAVRRSAEGVFDLVLMDCQMPGTDGFEATRRIRRREAERPELGRTPIVALTANASSEDRDECLAAGMDDFLAKPFTKEVLRAKLASWLAPARAELAPR